MNEALARLIDEGRLWRGDTPRRVSALPTGHAALDAALPGGGWPLGGVSEILHPAPGSGELRLILPALARLTRAERPVALVAPPLIPYAPGWAQAGVVLRQLVVVGARQTERVRVACELLQAGAAALALWTSRLDETDTRRLALHAEAAQAALFWLRGPQAQAAASSAALRLAVDGERVGLLKVRGGAAGRFFKLAA